MPQILRWEDHLQLKLFADVGQQRESFIYWTNNVAFIKCVLRSIFKYQFTCYYHIICLDDFLQFIPEQKVLKWLCCLSETFLGADVAQIVPYSDGVAAITKDGWFLVIYIVYLSKQITLTQIINKETSKIFQYYGEIKVGGVLEVQTAYKLSSNVIRYIHFPENPDSFFAVTESVCLLINVKIIS